MTNSLKIEIANEIQDMEIAGCYADGTIECHTFEQLDNVICWLEHMDLSCTYRELSCGGETVYYVTIS
jgi:hypothetical protein